MKNELQNSIAKSNIWCQKRKTMFLNRAIQLSILGKIKKNRNFRQYLLSHRDLNLKRRFIALENSFSQKDKNLPANADSGQNKQYAQQHLILNIH